MMVKAMGDHAAVVMLGEVSGLRIAGAPWWAIFLLCASWLAVDYVGAVFPQESAHRLAWWRDRRKARASGSLDGSRISCGTGSRVETGECRISGINPTRPGTRWRRWRPAACDLGRKHHA
jgi:hypothetical protein